MLAAKVTHAVARCAAWDGVIGVRSGVGRVGESDGDMVRLTAELVRHGEIQRRRQKEGTFNEGYDEAIYFSIYCRLGKIREAQQKEEINLAGVQSTTRTQQLLRTLQSATVYGATGQSLNGQRKTVERKKRMIEITR